jgi:cyanophycin synthetase
MIANALAASLAAFAQGVRIEDIRTALMTFEASVNQTPGRMNLFNLGHYHALVDYAHNPHSYQALGNFVKNWTGERIGIVGGPGDRRDEDFVTLGKLSAEIFDRLIIKEDDDTRGRPRGEAAQLIAQGVMASGKALPYEVMLNETEAVNTTLDQAPSGSLVVILPEIVSRAIDLIKARNPKPDLDLPVRNQAPEAAHPIHNIPLKDNSPFQLTEAEGVTFVQSGS